MENSQQINTEIRISDIISTDFHSYRVLGMKQDLISLIRLNTNKIEIIFHRSADLLAMIESGEVNLVHQQRVQDENTESRSITVNDAFKEKLAIVTEIDRTFGPLYEDLIQRGKRNETIQNLILNYSYKKSNIYNLIRKWLQSGFNKNALIDHRNAKKSLTSYTNKTGRPRNPDVNHVKMIDAGIPLTNDVREHFEYGKRELLSGRSKNIRSAYSAVLGKYYTRIIVDDNTVRKERLPANECPTEAQFRYFIRKNVPKETLDRVKTSAREVRNDKRLLLSDSLYGIKGPMDIVEIDECELDVSLVSVEDRSIVVGRPVLYVMIDVYSRLIVGYSISFENNSIRGLTNCLLSLSDNMEEKCRKFGINLKPGLWPSGYLPYCIRSDYGSEYLSHAFTDICNALNIRKELVPPATGSLKGLVEQCFHQIHSRQNPNLQHKGLIEKRYDSDHHKTATLNINEMEAIIISSIVVHNNRYMSDYPLNPDMRTNNIEPRPVTLWKYGCEINGNPRPITNVDIFKYTLLSPVHASIDRTGINFKELSYVNIADRELLSQMYKAGRTRVPLETARIDERSIGTIYYLQDNVIKTASLNPKKVKNSGYGDLSIQEYKALQNKKKRQDSLGKDTNLSHEVALQEHQVNIIKEAEKKSKGVTRKVTDDIRKNRAKEKKRRSQKELTMLNVENSIEAENAAPAEQLNTKENFIPEISYEDALQALDNEIWGDVE